VNYLIVHRLHGASYFPARFNKTFVASWRRLDAALFDHKFDGVLKTSWTSCCPAVDGLGLLVASQPVTRQKHWCFECYPTFFMLWILMTPSAIQHTLNTSVVLYRRFAIHSTSVVFQWKLRVYTLCLKKRPTFTTCCYFYIHSSIATIFGTNVAEKSRKSKCTLFFPPHLTSASALPGETGNPEIAYFHLNVACFFTKKYETQLKISSGQSWTNLHCQNDRLGAPDRTWEGSIASCCLLRICSVLAKSVAVSVAV